MHLKELRFTVGARDLEVVIFEAQAHTLQSSGGWGDSEELGCTAAASADARIVTRCEWYSRTVTATLRGAARRVAFLPAQIRASIEKGNNRKLHDSIGGRL